MLGLMMDQPLLISTLIEHAARFHGAVEVVSRESDRSVTRLTYAKVAARARQAAGALTRLGIGFGDRVATMAWNTHRHFELYYGISGIGAVMHTINPRLFIDQIRYMVNHAEDQILCFDGSFASLVETLAPMVPGVRHFVFLGAEADLPPINVPGLVAYETLIAAEPPVFDWPWLDERTASSLCYTSGTTGNPKGALYSHRSTVLHAMGAATADMVGLSARDAVAPVVPMFHVNAWGIPYCAALTGAKLVLPGQHLDGASLCQLFRDEAVTVSLAVPTVWLNAFAHLDQHGGDFGALQRVVIGGSACPPAMITRFREQYGVQVLHAWGMTEMSPLGTVSNLKHHHRTASAAEVQRVRETAGRPCCLVDLKIVGPDGQALPHDGIAVGDLHVRGPWVVAGYFNDAAASAAARDPQGWFKTGDVAAIDPEGYIRITDRSKDVIKSGGEWISSIDLENAAVAHPDIAEAAVIGVPHPKWDERPLLIVVLKPDRVLDPAQLLAFMAERVAKWWLPDRVIAVDEIPHTATGKILKTRLRELFAR